MEFPYWRLSHLQEVAQGPKRPSALEGRPRPLSENHRRPLRDHSPNAGDRRCYRATWGLARGVPHQRRKEYYATEGIARFLSAGDNCYSHTREMGR